MSLGSSKPFLCGSLDSSEYAECEAQHKGAYKYGVRQQALRWCEDDRIMECLSYIRDDRDVIAKLANKRNNPAHPTEHDEHGWQPMHPKDPPKVSPTVHVEMDNTYYRISKDLWKYKWNMTDLLIDAGLHMDNMLQRIPEQYRRKDRIMDHSVVGSEAIDVHNVMSHAHMEIEHIEKSVTSYVVLA